jgi:hypothetical protein
VNVAAADWDGDGDIDLFTGSRYGDLLYFENVGQPTRPLFAPARIMNAPEEALSSDGEEESAPSLGDMDGDGTLDLLVTVGREVYLYRGGRTASTSGVRLPGADGGPLLPERGAATAADVNADGLIDLLIGTQAGRVLLALNGGTPTAPKFAAPQPIRQGGIPVSVPGRARVTGWKDDGAWHLALGGEAGQLRLLDIVAADKPHEAAPSKLSVPPEQLATLKGGPLCPAAADLSGDGRTDILVGTGRGAVATLMQQADGRFSAGEPLQQRDAPIDVGSFSAPVLADWNGDGLADLVVGDEAGTIRVFPRLPATLYAASGQLGFGPGRQLELNGTTISVNREPLGRPYEYVQPLVADWDGDGDVDLLASGNEGVILFYRNVAPEPSGWPLLSVPERLQVGRELIQQSGPVSMCVHDRNGDGDPDLFVGSGAHIHPTDGLVPSVRSGGLVYYENIAASARQQPRFFKGARLEARVPVTWPAPAFEDLSPLDVGIVGITDWDADGKSDFLISGALGNVYLCSSPTRPGEYPRLFLVADPARAPGGRLLEHAYAGSVADVNGDGRDDIVAGSARYGFVRWFDRNSLPTPIYRRPTFAADTQCTVIDLSRALQRSGTVTSWRIAIGQDNERTQYRLKVFRPNGRYVEFVGQSQWRRVEPGWNAFSCHIPGVRTGDLVGFASGPELGMTVVVAAPGGAGLCRAGEDIEAQTLHRSWSEIEVRPAVEATVQ